MKNQTKGLSAVALQGFYNSVSNMVQKRGCHVVVLKEKGKISPQEFLSWLRSCNYTFRRDGNTFTIVRGDTVLKP